jgi:hypothetical protein
VDHRRRSQEERCQMMEVVPAILGVQFHDVVADPVGILCHLVRMLARFRIGVLRSLPCIAVDRAKTFPSPPGRRVHECGPAKRGDQAFVG